MANAVNATDSDIERIIQYLTHLEDGRPGVAKREQGLEGGEKVLRLPRCVLSGGRGDGLWLAGGAGGGGVRLQEHVAVVMRAGGGLGVVLHGLVLGLGGGLRLLVSGLLLVVVSLPSRQAALQGLVVLRPAGRGLLGTFHSHSIVRGIP